MSKFDSHYQAISDCLEQYLKEKNDGGWSAQVKTFQQNVLPQCKITQDLSELKSETQTFCNSLQSPTAWMTFGALGGSSLKQKLDHIILAMKDNIAENNASPEPAIIAATENISSEETEATEATADMRESAEQEYTAEFSEPEDPVKIDDSIISEKNSKQSAAENNKENIEKNKKEYKNEEYKNEEYKAESEEEKKENEADTMDLATFVKSIVNERPDSPENKTLLFSQQRRGAPPPEKMTMEQEDARIDAQHAKLQNFSSVTNYNLNRLNSLLVGNLGQFRDRFNNDLGRLAHEIREEQQAELDQKRAERDAAKEKLHILTEKVEALEGIIAMQNRGGLKLSPAQINKLNGLQDPAENSETQNTVEAILCRTHPLCS